MINIIKHIILEAGNSARDYFNQGVEHSFKSSPSDFLTEVDIKVSNFIIEKIKANFPEHGILSEEKSETINPESEYRWLIDPICGTRNFANRVPFWCISCALTYKGNPILGTIYAPVFNQFFWAEDSKGAFLLNTATNHEIKLSMTEPESFEHIQGFFIADRDWPYYEKYLKAVKTLLDKTDWVKNMASMLQACYLATGGAHFFISNYGYVYDYMSIALICKEAGAVISDSEGNEWSKDRTDIIIAHPKIHNDLISFLN